MGYPETSGSGKNPELTQVTKYLNPQLFPEMNKKDFKYNITAQSEEM